MFYIVYEAVLPLPTCMKEDGCRSIIERKDSNDGFDLDGDFVISTKVLNISLSFQFLYHITCFDCYGKENIFRSLIVF